MTLALMFAALLLSTPAWTVPTEPVLWGSLTMAAHDDYAPRVTIRGLPFDGPKR